jgi:hypothetical protein
VDRFGWQMELFSSSFMNVAGCESYGETRFLGGRISFMRCIFIVVALSDTALTPPPINAAVSEEKNYALKSLSCHSNSLSIDFILKGRLSLR